MINIVQSEKIKKFQNRPIMALDYGTKVIGTAKFTPGLDPFPLMLEKIIVQSAFQIIKEITKLINEESIEVIIIGIPYFVDGKESEQTAKTKSFYKLMTLTFPNIEFHEQDETLTTKEAEDRMKNSPQFNFKIDPTQIDCLSAVIILEDFLKTE